MRGQGRHVFFLQDRALSLNLAAMDNPYSAPNMVQPPSGQAFHLEPRAIKVFGVLHIIFAGFGILSVLFGLVFIFAVEPIFNMLAENMAESGGSAAEQEAAEIIRLLGDMYQGMIPYYAVWTAISAVLVILLMRAGVLLVKKRKNAASASHLWSWAVVGATIINIPISLLYTLPLQREFQEKITEATGTAATSASPFESASEIVGLIFGVVIALIYPILALIFLKRANVTEFLATQGK